MRSLTWRLTLAFLLVGVIGAVSVAVLIGVRTRAEFDNFVGANERAELVTLLSEYYELHGTWAGVSAVATQSPELDRYIRAMVLADARGKVVVGNNRYQSGKPLPDQALNISTPIKVADEVVGYVLLASGPSGGPPSGGQGRPRPEDDFLERVAWITAASAGVAALIALLLGGLLARTLAQPIRELTAATRALARGQLEQKVTVRSQDELGDLAAAFNQMSADLARASQLRKQMTADLAHDLRTPLSILRGYTEGLRDGRLQASAKTYAIMHGEVEHLQRLVEDLRLLSLADAGELTLNLRAVDPRALLERTGLAYFMQAEKQGVTLQVDAPEDLPAIVVDTDRMTQVLNNLVSNALRHTPKGQVALTAQAENGQVRLRVSDTGQGIAPEDLPFVFDRFYRADKARQRDEGKPDNTTGLGLAIAKAIVEAHRGVLAVASTLGQGTTFTITFDASTKRAA